MWQGSHNFILFRREMGQRPGATIYGTRETQHDNQEPNRIWHYFSRTVESSC